MKTNLVKSDILICKSNSHAFLGEFIRNGDACVVTSITTDVNFTGDEKEEVIGVKKVNSYSDLTWMFINLRNSQFEYIWDCFYTKVELRNEKLKKLKCIR